MILHVLNPVAAEELAELNNVGNMKTQGGGDWQPDWQLVRSGADEVTFHRVHLRALEPGE